MVPTRFIFATLLTLSGVFLLPSVTHADLNYFNNIQQTSAGGFDPLAVWTEINNNKSALVVDMYVKETISGINAITTWGLRYNELSDNEDDFGLYETCKTAYMYIYNVSSSTLKTAFNDDWLVQDQTLITLTDLSTTTDSFATFVTTDTFSLTPGYKQLVIEPNCDYTTHRWNYAWEADYADTATSTQLDYYFTYIPFWGDKGTDDLNYNTAYTGYKNAPGISFDYNLTYELGTGGSYVQIYNLSGWDEGDDIVYTTDSETCNATSLTPNKVYCAFATTTEIFYYDVQFSVADKDDFYIKAFTTDENGAITNTDYNEYTLDNENGVINVTLTSDRLGWSGQTDEVLGLHACASRYDLSSEDNCASLYVCSGYTDEQCELAVIDSISLGDPGLNRPPTQVDTVMDEWVERIKTFGVFAFWIPFQTSVLGTLENYAISGTSSTSTDTTFDIPLNMSAFGLPTTTAHLPVGAMFQEAENLSPEFFEYIDYFLWGLFWLFILSRILSGAWNVLPERGSRQDNIARFNQARVAGDLGKVLKSNNVWRK